MEGYLIQILGGGSGPVNIGVKTKSRWYHDIKIYADPKEAVSIFALASPSQQHGAKVYK